MPTLGLVLVSFAFPEHLLWAQTPTRDTATSAAMITAGTLMRHLEVLSADSLRERPTPSVALERTAEYVAAQFEAMGLQGGVRRMADQTSPQFIERYWLAGQRVRLMPSSLLVFTDTLRAGSAAVVTEAGKLVSRRLEVPFATLARFIIPRLPAAGGAFWNPAAPAVLLLGRPTQAFLRQAEVADKVVLYVPPAGLDTVTQQALVEEIYQASLGVVLLAVEDSTGFATRLETSLRQPLELVNDYLGRNRVASPYPWGVQVWAGALKSFLPMLSTDLMRARTIRAPVVRELPGLRVGLFTSAELSDDMPTAPNVAGVLEGTDSILKQECIVISAPLDQRARERQPRSRPAGVDSTTWIADASTTSLAGLLELIRAFRTAKPKRSMIFLAASGGGQGQEFWGARYFLYEYLRRIGWNKDVCRPVLALTVDLNVGGPVVGDTVVFAGLNDVEVAMPPDWALGKYSELKLVIGDGGTVTQPRSDAFAFSRIGVPSLLMQGGSSEDGVASAGFANDMVRRLQLVFYLGRENATIARPARWSADGRSRAFAAP